MYRKGDVVINQSLKSRWPVGKSVPGIYCVRLCRSVAIFHRACGVLWLWRYCVSAMSPEEGKGAANDFPGWTDDPQHGLLVSGLAHRTEMPKDSIDSVAAQSQFLPLTLLLLSRLCESVWQNQLQCHYASRTTKLQVRNRLMVLCSSEGTVPAKNQLRPLGVSSFALLSIVTEREKKKKTGREITLIYMMQHWPHDTTDQSMFSMQSQYHAQGKSRHILSEHCS